MTRDACMIISQHNLGSMASFRSSAAKLPCIKRLKYTIASRFLRTNSADTNSSFFKLHADDKAKVRVLNYAVAIWPVTGQGFQNTKWPAVLYSQ